MSLCRFGVREAVVVIATVVATVAVAAIATSHSSISAAQIDFGWIWQGISDWFNRYIATPIGNLASSIWDWMRQLVSIPFSILVDAGKALYNGVVGVFNIISDAVNSVLRSFFGG